MKKQGDFYLKFTSILLAVLLTAYLVCSLFLKGEDKLRLETAVYCEVGDGITVSGFVVRPEEYLVSPMPIVVTELTEGQRVGGGQVVATGYESGEARSRREELNALQKQREQLALAAAGYDTAGAGVIDGQISQLIVNLSGQTAYQRFESMGTLAAQLQPLILRRCVTGDDAQQIQQRLETMDQQISALETQTANSNTPIIAPRSGYFSGHMDGYEEILTPSALGELTLGEFQTLDQQTGPVPEAAVGRLITGQTWYFVTEVPVQRLHGYEKGDRLDVSFAQEDLQELRMTIERIGEAQGDTCLVVLSCDKKMQNVTALRRQSANLVFGTTQGLRVPKKALYHVEGETGVYVLSGPRAKWKPVEILCEYGEDYLVAWDSSNTDNLWPKDELIITAEELTDGKVIQ